MKHARSTSGSSSSAVAAATWWMLMKLLTEARKGRQNSSAKRDNLFPPEDGYWQLVMTYEYSDDLNWLKHSRNSRECCDKFDWLNSLAEAFKKIFFWTQQKASNRWFGKRMGIGESSGGILGPIPYMGLWRRSPITKKNITINWQQICSIFCNKFKFIVVSSLTLRREIGVKLTPDPINCLILKNGLNLYRPDFATFNIYLLPSIWHI